MKETQSTELKIKEAAKRVFLAKGFDGCTTREIAAEAGENVASVNYYFKSKAGLFEQIFQSASAEMIKSLVGIFESNISIQEKITKYIDLEFEFLEQFPEIPMFILSETNRKGGCQMLDKNMFEVISNSGIFDELEAAQKSGDMIEIELYEIIVLLLSNCHYPYMSKSFMGSILDTDINDLPKLNLEYKNKVKRMIVNYLFPTK